MHNSLPPQDDEVAPVSPGTVFTGTLTGTTNSPVHLDTPGTVRARIEDELLQNNDFVKRVLLRSDLTQVIARLGLFDHFKQKLLLAEPVPERSTFKVGNDYVYLISVGQRGTQSNSISLMVHSKKFSPSELNVMVTEAAAITDKSRVQTRREALAKSQTKIPSYTELNQNTFPGDVEFMEAVMMDKYQFRKLLTQNSGAEIEATAKPQV